MNKFICIGRLCSDPVAKRVGDKTVSEFRVAVQRRFANQQGVREADFFQVVVWGKTAEFCNTYLSKGRQVAVEGSIQNRSYDAQDGSKRTVTEIRAVDVQALGDRENGSQRPTAAPSAQQPAQEQFQEVVDDDLPF